MLLNITHEYIKTIPVEYFNNNLKYLHKVPVTVW